MIDIWALPGPAALVATVAADLIDGRHCLLYGAPPQGFRRAVECALAARQMRMRVTYDDPELDPPTLLLREAAPGIANLATLPAGVWWVEGIASNRATIWAVEAVALAERTRHVQPDARALLAVLLPSELPDISGLDILWRRAEPLSRIDLEVAARYQAASGRVGALAKLRMTLAIEMASPFLPGATALDALSHWMAAPDAALIDQRQFAQHCAGLSTHCDLTPFRMWRAQYEAFLPEIERLRLELVRSEAPRWRLPYHHEPGDGRPAKDVFAPEFLEIPHLCAQLSGAGIPFRSPIRRRLERLRNARNALSHMEPLTPAEVVALADELDSCPD